MTNASGPIDWLVLTAANAPQARAYRAFLRTLPAGSRTFRRVLVCADPRGRRIGSGGATVLALDVLRRAGARDTHRAVIIHSGGDSRRLPAFGAGGKLFAPVPVFHRDAGDSSLFDLIVPDVCAWAARAPARVTIASGDVYLGLAAAPTFDHASVGALAFPASARTASRHGVFVVNRRGVASKVLQKPTRGQLLAAGALDSSGFALVDAGLVAFAWPVALALRSQLDRRAGAMPLLQQIRRAALPPLDFYTHVLASMGGVTAREYAARFPSPSPGWPLLLRAIHHVLARHRLHVGVAGALEFLHVGSTRELLDHVGDRATLASIRSTHDMLRAGPGCVVHTSRLSGRVTLAGRNLVVGLDCPDAFSLPRGMGLVRWPIGRRDWACVAFSERDDFKTPLEAGATLCGRPLRNIAPAVVFAPGTERSAWTARLWRVGSAAETTRHALRVLGDIRTGKSPPATGCISLAEILPLVNHDRSLAWQEQAAAGAIESALSTEPLPSKLGTGDLEPIHTVLRRNALRASILRAVPDRAAPLDRARLWRLSAELHAPSRDAARTNAFREVAAEVFRRAPAVTPARSPGVKLDQVVWVRAPVRIDLAGGWSDTPPICNEHGGAVVNVALGLCSQHPLQVVGRLSPRPVVRISSIDLGESREFTSAAQIMDCRDPGDWCALPKAALRLSGLVPARRDESLRRHLERFGAGVDITVFSAVPKGSGLGTSSILGAATLACLARLVGSPLSTDSLIERTLFLEQVMGTAGGWQDQVGGVIGGFKLITSTPGSPQRPHARRITVPPSFLDDWQSRTLLYYTGQRRLAADILQGVVWRYLARERGILAWISRLKESAHDAAAALRAGDLDALTQAVGDYWTLKQQIDPGVSTPATRGMIDAIRPDALACELPGAGGGGFIFAIAKDRRARERIRRRLDASPPNPLARFFDFHVDPAGMVVGVL